MVSPATAQYSSYERETIANVLSTHGWVEDLHPEKKRIRHIRVTILDVIEKRDPVPTFLNWFHVNTQSYVVEREVLLESGKRFNRELADETARNLRLAHQVSLVLCIPIQVSESEVDVVIIVKDVWSLRLNSNFRYAGGNLEYLFLQPTEENLIGTHQAVAGQFVMKPDTIALGAKYTMPRIGMSRILFSMDANIIVNQTDGRAEGSYGSLSYGQPLYSSQAKWAWGTTIAWRNEIARLYQNGVLATYDADATSDVDAIPYQYRSDTIEGSYAVTRSFGLNVKHDFTVGMGVRRSVYRLVDTNSFNQSAVDEFEQKVLPVTDTRIYPFVQWHDYRNQFMHALNFNTLGLQEDYRLGHDVYLKFYPVSTALNSTRDFIGGFAGASYTWPVLDGLLRIYAETTQEIALTNVPDASVDVGTRIVSPQLGPGRLVYDGQILNRYENYLNQKDTLGGDTRLRGYPTQAFIGKDVITSNIEFRTVPVSIKSIQAGAVAFYDVGDAFDGFALFEPKQSLGFGIRALFPQLDKVVLRADWGFPLTPTSTVTRSFPGDIVVTFGQAFTMPVVDPSPAKKQ